MDSYREASNIFLFYAKEFIRVEIVEGERLKALVVGPHHLEYKIVWENGSKQFTYSGSFLVEWGIQP